MKVSYKQKSKTTLLDSNDYPSGTLAYSTGYWCICISQGRYWVPLDYTQASLKLLSGRILQKGEVVTLIQE